MKNSNHNACIFTLPELKEQYDVFCKLLSQLQTDHAYMQEALQELERMPGNHVPGDIAGQARAMATAEIVKARETTNQQLLAIYSKMYEDLRGVLFQSPQQPDASTTAESDPADSVTQEEA
jgi:hypothetical protein